MIGQLRSQSGSRTRQAGSTIAHSNGSTLMAQTVARQHGAAGGGGGADHVSTKSFERRMNQRGHHLNLSILIS
jgi:hypothetical protein